MGGCVLETTLTTCIKVLYLIRLIDRRMISFKVCHVAFSKVQYSDYLTRTRLRYEYLKVGL